MTENNMRNAVLGVITGDALGCPVQFESREEVSRHPVTGMRGYGSFNLPAGSWTDDSSLTIALLASIRECQDISLTDIASRFMDWLYNGAYTPFGFSFDIGYGTRAAIEAYRHSHDPYSCGGTSERNNGNGSLMRIIPACVFSAERGDDDETMIRLIDETGGLTHNHPRSKTACGLYAFMVRALIKEDGTLEERLQSGLKQGFAYYRAGRNEQLRYYGRLEDLEAFAKTERKDIRSSGYVVDSLEAAVWCLITEDSLEKSLLKAANLGEDTDTVAAIAGGLAGLYYTAKAIPEAWYEALQNKALIESFF
jgi:ADP-ribosylglycohydrolase